MAQDEGLALFFYSSTEGTLQEWKVSVGDLVQKTQVIGLIEKDTYTFNENSYADTKKSLDFPRQYPVSIKEH